MTNPDPKARRRAAKAGYERQRRERLREQGLVPVTVYVRAEDREAVKAVADRLNAKGEPDRQCVDHIDGDPTNSALDNLRVAAMPRRRNPAGDR